MYKCSKSKPLEYDVEDGVGERSRPTFDISTFTLVTERVYMEFLGGGGLSTFSSSLKDVCAI